VPEIAWTIDEALRQYILFYLTKGQETKIVIPTANRPQQ
jgi:endo-cleaving rubber dioxygenase